jgi:hypothetical protein
MAMRKNMTPETFLQRIQKAAHLFMAEQKIMFVLPALVLATLVFIYGCKEPFEPQIDFGETNFLVVEGYIDVGGGATRIKLTRTAQIGKKNTILVEKRAHVSIEDENGQTYNLTEGEAGVYTSAFVNLPLSVRYRLRIETYADKVYVSEFTSPIGSPAIDNISWKELSDGVEIAVSTHDEMNQTNYYQWEYEEVWEIVSPYKSYYTFETGSVKPRAVEETENMYRCWKYFSTPELKIASTASQSEDIVLDKLLLYIPFNDDRLSQKYSVLVRQHALSKEHYEYLQLMEKNTDQVGSFSDPQPSELFGNITCVSAPDEPVVGFIGSYATTEKRIYIYPHEISNWEFQMACFQVEVFDHPDSIQKYYVNNAYIPTVGASFSLSSPTPLTYFSTPRICVDCRQRGGINGKPDFWE